MAKSIVRVTAVVVRAEPAIDDHGCVGALKWATGETVAIKEIQLSNIPKSEIGQIMVCASPLRLRV